MGRIVVAAVVAASCGGPAGADGDLVVLGAASLSDAFGEIATTFTKDQSNVSVTLGFAGSSSLAAQVGEGAAADVFASADTATMDRVVASGLVAGEPVAFATNRLAIAVEPGNPLGIASLADLGDSGIAVALCAREVPCGRAAEAALQRAGVAPPPATREGNVRAVLTKVSLGEVDAGIVYATDVLAARDRVAGVGIPAEHNVTTTYAAAVLREAPDPVGAGEFVAFLVSREAQEILRNHGFGSAS